MARGSASFGGQGGVFYRFDPKKFGLEAKARNALGQWTSLQAVSERANRRAVDQMADWALEELTKRIRREEGPQGRTYRLENAIKNPRSHFVNRDGFEFLVASEMSKQAVYWRAIEHGSDHMVGKRIRLVFSSGGRYIPADRTRTGTGFGASARGGLDSAYVKVIKQKADGSRAQSRIPFVVVRRPIQAYGYGRAAIVRFQDNDFAWYRKAIAEEMARSGFQTVRR